MNNVAQKRGGIFSLGNQRSMHWLESKSKVSGSWKSMAYDKGSLPLPPPQKKAGG